MLSAPASGVDQLKEERLRYAAADVDTVEDQNVDCWDLSSEDECASAPTQVRHSSSSHTLAASGAPANLPAEPRGEIDKHDIFSYHNHLPRHAILAAGVKQMLQQHSTVRKCKRRSLTRSVLYLCQQQKHI